MSRTTFKNHGRWLCFLTLTVLLVAPSSSVAQNKTKNGSQALLSRKSTVPSNARATPHVTSASYKTGWGCNPFSRAGK
jgi:hypothetical protein